MSAPMGGFDDAVEVPSEPILGLRFFRLDPLFLRAVHHEWTWKPGVNFSECTVAEEAVERYYLTPEEMAAPRSEWEPEAQLRPYRRAFEFRQRTVPLDDHSLVDCSCGLYAWHSHRHMDRLDPRRIAAVIAGFGEVVLGSRGFRAQKARIVAIAPPLDPAARTVSGPLTEMGELYDVPVFERLLDMRTEFPPTYLDRFVEEAYPRLKGANRGDR